MEWPFQTLGILPGGHISSLVIRALKLDLTIPAAAMSMPTTQIMSERPTLPESEKMADGVAKIPVPIMRLKMRKTAEVTPIWRLAWRTW